MSVIIVPVLCLPLLLFQPTRETFVPVIVPVPKVLVVPAAPQPALRSLSEVDTKRI